MVEKKSSAANTVDTTAVKPDKLTPATDVAASGALI